MLPQFKKITDQRTRMNADTIRDQVHQMAPMVAMVPRHMLHEGSGTAIRRATGDVEETRIQSHSAQVEIGRMSLDEFEEKADALLSEIAEQFARSMSLSIQESVSEAAEKVGNVVDGGGKPMSVDLLHEALERIAHSFSETGEWQPPMMVVSPQQFKRIQEIEANTSPDDKKRLEDRLAKIIERKKSEYDLEQASRVLAG